jgi:hypothetical protein
MSRSLLLSRSLLRLPSGSMYTSISDLVQLDWAAHFGPARALLQRIIIELVGLGPRLGVCQLLLRLLHETARLPGEGGEKLHGSSSAGQGLNKTELLRR